LIKAQLVKCVPPHGKLTASDQVFEHVRLHSEASTSIYLKFYMLSFSKAFHSLNRLGGGGSGCVMRLVSLMEPDGVIISPQLRLHALTSLPT